MTVWITWIAVWMVSMSPVSDSEDWTALFNGQDLTGWERYLGIPHAESDVPTLTTDVEGNYISDLGLSNDPLGVFGVVSVDGKPSIRISGEVPGTLIAPGSYRNYHLKLQYKWGEKKWPPRRDLPRDSGLLYHGFGEPGAVRMRYHHTQELQIQEGDCGDYWPIGNVEIDIPSVRTGSEGWFQYNPDGNLNRFVFAKDLQRRRCIKSSNSELQIGEWNTVELICWGDSSIHVINGVVQMRLYKSVEVRRGLRRPLKSGRIALQSGGAEVFFRNIEIRPISSIPPEFSESNSSE